MPKTLQARDDQREVNNLPKLSEPQAQGRMLVIDEASDINSILVRELLAMAKDLMG